jgi:hypothetical protein
MGIAVAQWAVFEFQFGSFRIVGIIGCYVIRSRGVIFLPKVEDTFQIPERGCVVMLHRPSPDIELPANDSIQLRTPEGRVIIMVPSPLDSNVKPITHQWLDDDDNGMRSIVWRIF